MHGFPLNSFQWRGAIERLSAHRRCIAADMMAHGQTMAKDGQDLSVGAQADMLADLLDRLKIGTVDIVANDSGGAVAQIFLARHPSRVRTLLLTNCDTEPDSPPPAVKPVIELGRQGLFADKWLAPWAANKELARSANGLGGLCFQDPSHPSDEAIDSYLGPMVSSPERKAQINAYAAALDPNPLAGIEAKLKTIQTPTRIIWGMADNIFAKSSADYLDGLFPNSKGVLRLPEAKLFFPEEYPEVIADEARKLWGVA
jgi:pimeloyl-ACP methyl ester carboxylesterase